MTTGPAMLLGQSDLEAIISMRDAVEAVRRAHVEWGHHHDLNAICHRIHAPSNVRICAHQGVVPSLSVAGLLVHCERLDESARQQSFTTADPPVSVVYDAVNGRLRGILVGEPTCIEVPKTRGVAGLRTAATGALGTIALARRDASTVAMIGSGKQAALQLVALHSVRPLRRISVFSRNPDKRNRCAAMMADVLGTAVIPVATVAAAVVGSDIVLTATNSMQPVIEGTLLEPGQHITSIVGGGQGSGPAGSGRSELDATADERAAVIGMASVSQARAGFFPLAEKPVVKGKTATAAYPYWHKCVELYDLLTARHLARKHDEDITIFKNNAGQGVADVALAGAVLDRAAAQGLGRPVWPE
jgi:ornithine cyclodeaminase/alanine dehydrogenase-like protein (mu-crystallin family)